MKTFFLSCFEEENTGSCIEPFMKSESFITENGCSLSNVEKEFLKSIDRL